MTAEELEDLLRLFMAAVQVVVPSVTSEQRTLVHQVVDGMLRERASEARIDMRNK